MLPARLEDLVRLVALPLGRCLQPAAVLLGNRTCSRVGRVFQPAARQTIQASRKRQLGVGLPAVKGRGVLLLPFATCTAFGSASSSPCPPAPGRRAAAAVGGATAPRGATVDGRAAVGASHSMTAPPRGYWALPAICSACPVGGARQRGRSGHGRAGLADGDGTDAASEAPPPRRRVRPRADLQRRHPLRAAARAGAGGGGRRRRRGAAPRRRRATRRSRGSSGCRRLRSSWSTSRRRRRRVLDWQRAAASTASARATQWTTRRSAARRRQRRRRGRRTVRRRREERSPTTTRCSARRSTTRRSRAAQGQGQAQAQGARERRLDDAACCTPPRSATTTRTRPTPSRPPASTSSVRRAQAHASAFPVRGVDCVGCALVTRIAPVERFLKDDAAKLS